MRLLHTGDWHLGRHFEGRSLEPDHAAVLDQVLRALQEHAPDALIIAGDIFDRASPPESAVRQFNDFAQRVTSQTSTAIVLIAGNHDSGDRIGAMAMLSDRRRALVRGPISRDEHPLILHDTHGAVAISALPFAYEHAARECFDSPAIKAPADVLRAQVEAARAHVPAGARWVVVAHAFVAGADTSQVERPLVRAVGGIETVPADVFDGASYVALGHLHRAQTIGSERIRYSGSPLAFGFDEEGSDKSLALVDLDGDGTVATRLLPLTPLRRVRTLRGRLADLLAAASVTTDTAAGRAATTGALSGNASGADDFVRAILTDPGRLVDAMRRLREVYPNACSLIYQREEQVRVEPRSARPGGDHRSDPATVVAEFLALVRGVPADPAEQRIVAAQLAALADPDTPDWEAAA